MKVYHYTNKAGYDAIMASGILLASYKGDSDDAAFGNGVYFTRLPPTTGKKALAINNYNNIWATELKNGKVDYWFELVIPDDQLVPAKTSNGRDVYKNKSGKNIKLGDYPCKDGKTSD